MSLYTMFPLVGEALAPIAAGFMVESISWRWTFHVMSISMVLSILLGLFWMEESYGPLLFTKNLRHRAPNSSPFGFRNFVSKLNLLRPAKLMATQPVLQAMTVNLSFIYGVMYIATTSFPTVWSSEYGEDSGTASLNYISLAVGYAFASQCLTPLQDNVCLYKAF